MIVTDTRSRKLAPPKSPKRPHRACGEQNANARITWAVARQIRADAAEGAKYADIAWWHGVNPGTVHKIINNVQWVERGDVRAAIPPKRPAGAEHGNARHTWATVRAIRAAYAGGATTAAIARRFDAHPTTVHKIINNLQWIEP